MHYNSTRYLEVEIVGQGRQPYINLICCGGSAAWNELYIIYGFKVLILWRRRAWWNNVHNQRRRDGETQKYGMGTEEGDDGLE